MADRCFHGSPIENCADCLIERLTRELSAARAEIARLADGESQDARAAITNLTRERDEARLLLEKWDKDYEGVCEERDDLRALLREVEWVHAYQRGVGDYVDTCPLCGGWKDGDNHAPDCRLAAALKEGRDG